MNENKMPNQLVWYKHDIDSKKKANIFIISNV